MLQLEVVLRASDFFWKYLWAEEYLFNTPNMVAVGTETFKVLSWKYS